MKLRGALRDYTRSLMKDAHETGSPIMRPCFYDFPKDETCWTLETQYMYGAKYLVCPVLNPEQRSIEIYLPEGAKWKLLDGAEEVEGGKVVRVDCPVEVMPVFVRQS